MDKQPHDVRSVRIPDDLYKMIQDRARKDGTTFSWVAYMFLQGYAIGAINLPVVDYTHVYDDTIEVTLKEKEDRIN